MPGYYECPLVLNMLKNPLLWVVGKQINLFLMEENELQPDSVQQSAAVGLTLKEEEEQLWRSWPSCLESNTQNSCYSTTQLTNQSFLCLYSSLFALSIC